MAVSSYQKAGGKESAAIKSWPACSGAFQRTSKNGEHHEQNRPLVKKADTLDVRCKPVITSGCMITAGPPISALYDSQAQLAVERKVRPSRGAQPKV